jgi:hypothetical protein
MSIFSRRVGGPPFQRFGNAVQYFHDDKRVFETTHHKVSSAMKNTLFFPWVGYSAFPIIPFVISNKAKIRMHGCTYS